MRNESVIVDSEGLKKLCVEWQNRLHLHDWDIKTKIMRERDFKNTEAQAENSWVLQTKQSLIRIVDPIDYITDTEWPQDMEYSLVHELLHLHFAPFDNFTSGSLEDKMMEQAIDVLARSFIELKRGELNG